MFVPALTLILALTSSAVIAVPIVNNIYKRAVASLDPSSAEFTFYFPESFYESIPHSGAPPSSSSETDDAKTATDYIFKKLDLGENDFKVVDSYTDYFGISHVYGTHMINDVGVSNHQAAAHAKNGEVAFFSTSFGTEQHLAKKDLIISEPKATLDFKQASATASAQLGIPVYSEVEHTFMGRGVVFYYTGEAIQAADFGKEASYQVIARPHRDPTDGFSGLAKVSTEKFTPRRWTDGKVTEGNNAITRDPSGKPTRSIGNDVFYTQFNSREEPGSAANIAAAAAGNFQTDNFDLGGKGNDAVIINVLDLPKLMVPNFSPPDGQPGVMNMYRFTKTTPNRNPGLDNAIVIHEYAHGISDRLTGGLPLPLPQHSRGKRHEGGVSDFMAMFFLAKESDTDMTEIPIGAYSENNPKGVRMRLYTTAITINPLTYRSLKTRRTVQRQYCCHEDYYWWNDDQPCNPTFFARDAIIATDNLHYQGDHKCEIYRGFAKRGLGLGATDTHKNDFTVPPECRW
ncbi:hypothetical protein BSLG_010855 [Batrachochytrium salamandrivorans]|nr:hypothetical protein BSLG_010855 [Batrachochytrium salamandrivorans]